jgi:hypothetical protein
LRKINLLFDEKAKDYKTIDFNGLLSLLQQVKAERERESKIAKLRRKIAKLEAIVGRTPQEEQDLKDKRAKLAELENQQQSGGGGDLGEPKKTNWTPWLIGGGIILILVIGIIAYLWIKQSSKE